MLVIRDESGQFGGNPGGDRNHTLPARNSPFEHPVGLIRYTRTPVEDYLRGALRDQEPLIVPIDEDRHAATVVIEGSDGDTLELGGTVSGYAGPFPQSDIEGVATDRAPHPLGRPRCTRAPGSRHRS